MCVCFEQKVLLGIKESDIFRTYQPRIHQHKTFKNFVLELDWALQLPKISEKCLEYFA